MTPRTLLLLLLALPAAAAGPDEDDLDRDHAELVRMMEEATPSVQGLETLSKRYFEQKDVRALEAEHDQLQGRVEPFFREMASLHTRLKSGLEVYEARVLSEASAGLLAAGDRRRTAPPDIGPKLLRLNSLKQSSDHIQAFRERTGRAIYNDNLAFTSALGEQEKRERASKRARGAALALLVTLLPLGALFIRARVRRLPTGIAAPLPALEAHGLRLERPLGQDPLGDLYAGTETARGRPVLVRRLRPELADDDLQALLAEARLAATVKHPAVLETYAVFREGGRAFLSLEPREGLPLSERLKNGPLPQAEARKILTQAAAALDQARARGLLHKDLRPGLVWLSPSGQTKVADFAVSRTARLAVAKRVRSEDPGPDPYQAPESESGLYLPESDVYSLGAVYYEMLTGRPPFAGPDAPEKKREGVFPYASAAVPGLPDALDALFFTALSPDPKKRPRSAGELASSAERLGA